MRLWSIHPRYLDRAGLGACWREALLAQSVLARLQLGESPGYRNHPQLIRFKLAPNPLRTIAAYLTGVQEEATKRGYRYNADLILAGATDDKLTVTLGQLQFEIDHLQRKLRKRDPAWPGHWHVADFLVPEAHPLFDVVPGPVGIGKDWAYCRQEAQCQPKTSYGLDTIQSSNAKTRARSPQ